MVTKDVESKQPQNDNIKDKYLVVYTLFGFMGLLFFLPATFFVTAHDFWMYKFRNVSSDDIDPNDKTTLQAEFSASVTIATHVANFITAFLTLFFGYKLSVRLRLYGSLLLMSLLYIISAIFIHVDTDSWQTGFFVITMLIVGGINAMTTVLALTFFSVLYKFPHDYLVPFLNGQGVAGIFTAVLQILALAVGISTTKSALVYFWIAIGLIVAGLLLLFMVEGRNDFYRHYSSIDTHEKLERKTMSTSELLGNLKSIWRSLGILLFYLLTCSPTHPAITSLIVSEGKGGGQWNDVYFVPFTTFVLASTGEFVGRYTANRLKFLFKIDGGWFVAFSAVRVVVFVPLLMLCNVHPRSHLSVVFPHDYQYILIMVFFSVSNGMLLSIGQMLVPRTVPPEKLEDAYHVNLVGATILLGSLSFLGFVAVEVL